MKRLSRALIIAGGLLLLAARAAPLLFMGVSLAEVVAGHLVKATLIVALAVFLEVVQARQAIRRLPELIAEKTRPAESPFPEWEGDGAARVLIRVPLRDAGAFVRAPIVLVPAEGQARANTVPVEVIEWRVEQ